MTILLQNGRLSREIIGFKMNCHPDRSAAQGPAVNAICATESGVVPICPFG
jgi:hypothetical protein